MEGANGRGVLPLLGQGWRLPYVVVACLLSAAFFFGGQFVYERFFLDRPVWEELQAEPGVERVKVQRADGTEEVVVELGRVENLEATYRSLEGTLERYYRPGTFQLLITDRRSPALEELWDKGQFAVYEAAVRGNFTAMARELESQARAAGMDIKLDMDGRRIYVALYQGPYYLYEIVPCRLQGDGAAGGEAAGA
ncbi:hypothetical protein [Thermanaeromonas sp. C210]|uniref:hypothetical protein n=1 Tax=Thermanaeromonas sp. C210 TaxID=2731925 RepID=UPI00155B99DF|nr:hypothetical protein [Thermanaeromonas sp. C210]GFN23790.1 hypothetical protein TAMC210_21070 [Thermanaeromonas sp. C210]